MVSMAGSPDKEISDHGRTVSYAASSSVPIKRVRAYINGQEEPAKDGKIYIGVHKGSVKIKLVAITEELLAGSDEKEIIIEEPAPPSTRE